MILSKVRQVLTSLSQLETSENTTFFIQNTVRAAAGVETISIASGVTLVFDGGMIAGALTGNTETPEATLKLVGNFTSVEAPITQIFGDTVYAKGYWHIDCAYPQWFDAVVGTQSCDTANPHDCSVAINKAAEMKMSGEVFLPAGVYLVSHTIFLRHGINLTGDSATRTKYSQYNVKTGKEEEVRPDAGMVDGWGRATFITPFFENGKDGFVANELNGAGGAAIVAVNIKQLELQQTITKVAAGNLTPSASGEEKPAADVNYAHPFGSIEQIYFYNPNHRTKTSGAKDCADISQKVCCLVAGGFTFRHVFWENFCRAIKWTQDYNDSKTIYCCNMQSFFGGDVLNEIIPKLSDSLPYLIDSRGCGDAMIIDGCHLDRGVYKEPGDKVVLLPRKEYQLYKGIALRTCLGGSIRNSIIHSDIDIEHCTALEFADNHCELGMQMNIRWSQISIHDNFIEKGIVPNFVIHAMDEGGEGNATYSDLNFSDNKFICYNYANRIPVGKMSEYDILLKTRQSIAPYSIDLARNYRVSANKDLLSMHPTGIILATQDTDSKGVVGEIQPYKAFNDHSYFLSDRASIRRNLKLKQSNMVSSIPALTIDAMNNTNIPKLPNDNQLATAITYKFYFQAIADEPRAIASVVNQMSVNPSTDVLNYSSDGTQCGILFALHWRGDVEPCSLRIVRDTVLNGKHIKRHVVTVPVCGARFLHDNFTSVEGHLWMSVPVEKTGDDVTDANLDMSKIPEFITQPNSGIEAIQFIDYNVSCRASATPAAGEWKSGDTIVIKPSGSGTEQEWRDATVRIKN